MPSPTNDIAGYCFLPWMRRGIINQADATSFSDTGALVINISLQAIGNADTPLTIPQSLKIYGPGDVSGLDPRSIVRTIPLDGITNFEYNYLCGIEFYEEDLPWRYTPNIPAASQLAPWLWVLALKTTEFTRLGATTSGLQSIEVNGDAMAAALPAPNTSWAWAHTHLNFIPQGTSAADVQQFVESTLNQNSNLGCSRLLCPRRLEPATSYTAFLIPAFERGRLAGLGSDDATIAAAANTALSWTAGNATRVYPVYREWSFTTSDEGDFETLARLIVPLTEQEATEVASAAKTVDIRNPGWGLQYSGVPGSIPFESALAPYSQPAHGLLTDSAAAPDTGFTESVKNLLNLNADAVITGTASGQNPNPFFQGSTLEDDPMILPPMYGSFYRDNPLNAGSAKPVRLDATAPANDWYNQLNLNPSMRVGAGQGSIVVQQDQESYMNRAWDQLSQNAETNRLVKRWNYSYELSRSIFSKRLAPVLDQTATGDGTPQTFLSLALVSPMQQSLRTPTGSFTASLQKKFMPSAYSRSFTKLIRPGAPITRRLNKNPSTGTFFPIGIILFPILPDILYKTISDITDYLTSLESVGRRRIQPLPWIMKNLAIRNAGLMSIGAVEQALNGIAPYTMWTTIIVDPAPPPTNATLYTSISTQINPSITLVARLQGLLSSVSVQVNPVNNGITVNETPAVPEFPEPMYAPLADRSTDYILPGIENIPDNRVALLKTNPAFIESYMTGLNHEISREYLWREFPAALNITSFRQFWDVRDNQQAISDPETWKDIQPIAGWATTRLGTHQPPTQPVQDIVILIRADLLKKYPNTEIFLQEAAWTDNQKKSRVPVANPDNTTLRKPMFSAQVAGEFRFLGFDVPAADAIGNADEPGWFFVLKERAGEIHFGLDTETGSDPSWPSLDSETAPGNCIEANGAVFSSLPKYGGQRSDLIAGMLYQQPFMLFIHVSQMLPKN
jgi:hypothetical protein